MAETLWDLLTHAAATRGGHPAVSHGHRVLDYRALLQGAQKKGTELQERGVEPGDRVLLRLENGLPAVVALFGAFSVGAVPVSLHPDTPVSGVLAAARRLGVRGVLWSVDRPSIQGLDGEEVALWSLPGDKNVAELIWQGTSASNSGPDDLAAIFWTSGSTGPPKGVMHSHDSLVRCARDVAAYLGYRPDERLLGLLPLSFHYGFSQLTSAIAAGATLVIPERRLPADLLDEIDRHELTGVAGVPTTWRQLAAVQREEPRPLASLRLLCNAGGGLDAATRAQVAAAFPSARLHLLYGFTEALRSAHMPPELADDHPGSFGRAVPGVRLSVVADGRLCGEEELGELVHGGAMRMLGYWEDAEATARALRPCAALGGEIVAFSGDLVRRDKQGFLHFVARKDELIKSSGFRIGPGEVEAAALSSGLVTAAVAFGLEDALLGQAVVLVVCTADDQPPRLGALRSHMRAVFAPHARPRHILHHTGELPRTATGKLSRRELARWAEARLAEESRRQLARRTEALLAEE